MRFYAFHLQYRLHPGMVYQMMPDLFEQHQFGDEERLWFCFLNGNTQNVLTSWIIFEKFPKLNAATLRGLKAWYNLEFRRFSWDTDRRHQKGDFLDAVASYFSFLDGRTQREAFGAICSTDYPKENFRRLWAVVRGSFYSFGRLATFSYIEYLRIAGLAVDCDQLFLEDIGGSRSHRNGICRVLGWDDMDWTKDHAVTYSPGVIHRLTHEGERLLFQARARIDHPDVNYFTLESTLCCYKGWHRRGRRYPNVYNDMFAERIHTAERRWDRGFDMFWTLRADALPAHLLTEFNPKDVGLKPEKQNHYLNTGQVIMMNHEHECFKNDYNDTH